MLAGRNSAMLARALEGNDGLRDLLRATADWPEFTPEESLDYAQRVQAGDKEARNTLVLSCVHLCAAMASSYAYTPDEVDDLTMESVIGLMHAAEKFDGRCKFSTYAIWWVRQFCRRYGFNKRETIRRPVYIHDMLPAIRTFEQAYVQEHHRRPDDATVALGIRKPVEQVNAARSPAWHYSLDLAAQEEHQGLPGDAMSGDAPGGSSGRWQREISDATLPDIAEGVSMRDLFARVWTVAMLSLTTRERLVLALRYGLSETSEYQVFTHDLVNTHRLPTVSKGGQASGFSLHEVAKMLGCSHTLVLQQQQRAERRLSHACAKLDLTLEGLPRAPSRLTKEAIA